MAGTIIDYLNEYGNIPFAEMPMNHVDSLILCQLSYLKFDGIVSGVHDNGPSISLKGIQSHADFDKLFADSRYEEENRALFAAAVAGSRFCNLRLNCYINVVEKEWETQFSAVTFLLEDGTLYIAFRGTDETIVGWKEDFNMAFLSPVPGQAYSVKYLNMVMGRLYKPFYIGGHSKGGNLAVYSAMRCIPRVQERILRIYNMDGPGFRPEVLEEYGYDKIADRVVKILPHSSLIGMIFEREIRYITVESNRFGLAQHDPYTWLVEGEHFVLADDIYELSRFWDNTLNEWIYSLNEQQLRMMVDTLYQVISASKVENLIELTADWKKSMNSMVAAFKEIDEPTTRILKEIIKSLFELAKIRAKEEVTMNLPRRRRGGKRLSKSAEVIKQAVPMLRKHSDARDATADPE
ncbi:MAG: DUF2974 domain-containing protein [Lachnospiraceae bacterium]|nr:DUF2974 domain-containing protein [Lachnospiraceae bacterium]